MYNIRIPYQVPTKLRLGGESMHSEDKKRMTLYLDGRVKDELKKQAREHGVSASAYVSMLVMSKRDESRNEIRKA